jgi:hypothetical protein
MISIEDRLLYKKLCILFGAFQELIQGAGGNISIKSESQILLKASGTCLSETSDTEGFVICDRKTLEVLEGKGTPSMESGFHLLPKRIIVHFHSLSMLSNTYTSSDKLLVVPYVQPGKSLSDYLHRHYTNEPVVVLENHGVILLVNNEKEIYELLKGFVPSSLYDVFCRVKEFFNITHSCIEDNYSKGLPFSFCSYFLEMYGKKQTPSVFYPYTPDIYLFLKAKPLCMDASSSVSDALQEYIQNENMLPSVLQIGRHTFAMATSWKKCLNIRDTYEAYCQVQKNPPPTSLSESDCKALLACEKEAYRLR